MIINRLFLSVRKVDLLLPYIVLEWVLRQFVGGTPYGKTIGIDASPGMIEAAKKLESGNLSFVCMDINHMGFTNDFDLVFSNAALHWIKDHRQLLNKCLTALKPGGIIKWSFGGFGNSANLIETFVTVMASPEFKTIFAGFEWPWYMPAKEEYAELLKEAGFSGIEVTIENADRYFQNSDEMIRWIDQPCIVPFIDYLSTEEAKSKFRQTVVLLLS